MMLNKQNGKSVGRLLNACCRQRLSYWRQRPQTWLSMSSVFVSAFCVGARIITDIRPVFVPQHQKIVGSTLRQTLRLEFMSLDARVTSMSIGLDADDISRLKKECEAAINKAAVTRNTLQRSGLEEIIIPGEESQ